MSLKNQASDAGLTRNPALRVAIGQTATVVINLTKTAKHIKTHTLDAFTKKPCTGDGCQICAFGSKPREIWLIDCYTEDGQTGELRGAALFLSRQEFGALAEILPDAGLNCRVRVTGIGAVDKDGAPVTAKNGKSAGQQYVNLEFALEK